MLLARAAACWRRGAPRRLGATLALLTLLLVQAPAGMAAVQASTLSDRPTHTWQPNGPVHDVVRSPDGSRAYIGGQFSSIGPTTGSAVRLDPTTARQSGAWPSFSGGSVRDIVEVPDAFGGGWIVAGSFTRAGQAARSALARVTPAGLVDPLWGAGGLSAGAEVLTLAHDGTSLYVGGSFVDYGGVGGMTNLAKVSLGDGSLVAGWTYAAPPNQLVRDIELSPTDPSKVYVAGDFTTYDGATVSGGIMRLDAASADRDGWLAAIGSGVAGGLVRDIAIDPESSAVHLAGTFAGVGAAPRSRLAAVASDGTLLAWEPTVNGDVHSIALGSGAAYVGGAFTGANGVARSNLAAFDLAGAGAIRGWNPTPNGAVREVHVDGVQVYVGGDFTFIAGTVAHGAARIDGSADGVGTTTWIPMASRGAHAFLPTGTSVLMGGAFSSVGGVARNAAAAIDLATGTPLSWSPIGPGAVTVTSLALHGANVYVGGIVGSTPRVFPVDRFTGIAATAFLPGAPINDIEIDAVGNRLLVGGANYLKGFDLETRALNWDAGVFGGDVRDLEVSGETVYLGGSFTTVGGQARSSLAAVSRGTAAIKTWNPSATGAVSDLALGGTRIYVAGSFTSVAGGGGPYLAAVDGSGLLVPEFAPAVDAPVRTARFTGSTVVVGGEFQDLGGRRHVAELDAAGVPTSWAPTLPWARATRVNDLASRAGMLLVVGADGMSIFEDTADTVEPLAAVTRITDPLPGPEDGTYVDGATRTVVVGTAGATAGSRRFTVRTRAHDRVGSADPTWVGVSGLSELQWPQLANAHGSWSPDAGVVDGRPRGLVASCWRTAASDVRATGIDRSIDYGFDRPPDRLPARTASLAWEAGATQLADGSFDNIACQWTGHLLGMTEIAPGTTADYRFQTESDNGMKVKVFREQEDPSAPITDWTTWDYGTQETPFSAPSAPVSFAADQARPILVDWYDGTGQAAARLLWDTGDGVFRAVPAGAFVTQVDYERTYSLIGGAAVHGADETLRVTSLDRAGNTADTTAGDFRVVIDNRGPLPAESFTTTPDSTGWSNSPTITIAITDGAGDDGAAGVLDRRIERLEGSFDPGTGACVAPSPASWQLVATFTGSDTRSITEPVLEGCYRYRYVSRDRVGNETIDHPTHGFADAAWIRIDQTRPSGGSVLYPDVTQRETSVSVMATRPNDALSGLASVELWRLRAPLANGTCGAYGTPAFIAAVPFDGNYTHQPLQDGSCYRFELRAMDQAGNALDPPATSPAVVRVDTTAPAASFSASPSGVVSGDVPLTGTSVDAGSGATSIDVTYAGPASGPVCTTVAVSSGTWSCSFLTTSLPSGTYTLTLHAYDAAGNVGSATRTIEVDNSAPTLSLSGGEPAGGGYQHFLPALEGNAARLWVSPFGSGTFQLDAAITDQSAVTVEFPSLGTGWSPIGALTTTADPHRASWSWSGVDVASGEHVVRATDAFGRSTSAGLVVAVDGTPPAADAPVYGGGYRPGGATSVAWASVTDVDSGVDEASIALERQVGVLADDRCAYSGDYAPIPGATSPYLDVVADGACHRYRLVASDQVANEVAAAGPTEARSDQTAPTATLDASPAGPVSGPVTLTGTAADAASGVRHVDVGADGPLTSSPCMNRTIAADGRWSCLWDTETYPDGEYTVWVVATDRAGNGSQLVSRSIQVDNSPPSMLLSIAPATSSAYQHVAPDAPSRVWVNGSHSGTFRVRTGAVDSGTGIASVWFPALGTGWTPTEAWSAAPPYEGEYGWSAGAAAPGVRTITATDMAGGTRTASFEVLVDGAAPAGGSIAYPDRVGGAATIAFDPGTDSGSGLATWTIERREAATATATTCDGSWSSWSPLGAADPEPSVLTDSSVQRGRCYQYRLVVRDRVGHVETWTSSSTFVTDTPGVEITPVGSMEAVEGGADAQYGVALRAAPTSDVRIDLAPGAGAKVAPSQLTFTPDDWNVPQVVTVTAVDDEIDQTPDLRSTSIAHALTSADAAYQSLGVIEQPVQVRDNDVAALVVTPTSGISVTEGGAGAGYTIRLATKPLAPVTVVVDGSSQLAVTPGSVTFDAATWSTARTVAVDAVDDPVIEGPHGTRVTHSVSSADPTYAALTAPGMAVAIADDDAAGLDVVTAAPLIVDEASPTTTQPVRIRLTARPVTDVLVQAVATGQLAVSAPALAFGATNWDQYQTLQVAAGQDTVAEPTPHVAYLALRTSSSDPDFAGVPERVLEFGVRDDDPAALMATPGAGWTLSDSGRLQLRESGSPKATVHVRAVGDPSADLVIRPVLSPAGELQVEPASATIPAGSHARTVSFTVYAVDDRTAEPTPHAARITWRLATVDALYGGVVLAPTDVEITDGSEVVVREGGPTSPQPSEPAPKQPAPAQPADPPSDTAPEEPAPTQPTGAAPDRAQPAPRAEQPAAAQDPPRRSDPRPPPSNRGDDDSGDHDSEGGAVRRTARRIASWAKEHKAAAGIGISAAGTAALWGAKPMLLAGKALGGGFGGLPGTPDGLGQARRLLRLGKKQRQQSLLRRLLGMARRRAQEQAEQLDLEQLDADWDAWYDDRAA